MTDANATNDIKFMDRNPPTFSEDEAKKMVRDLFGLEGSFRLLVSERDQNFQIRDDSPGYVLKIANSEEDPGVLDFQTQALLHIEERDPELGVPRVVKSVNGNVTETVTSSTGSQHLVRVVTFLPGTLLEDLVPSSALLRDVGVSVARLDRALTGFFHSHAENPHPWDIMRAADMRPHTQHIDDTIARGHVETILDDFINDIGPRMRRLRHQVVHNDATINNVVIDSDDNDRVSGILDFGDMVHAPMLCELTMAIDTVFRAEGDPIEVMAKIAAGFDSIIPLEEDEVDLLFDAILTRLAISAVIIAWRRSVTPDQPGYLLDVEKPQQELIARLMKIGRHEARAPAASSPAFSALLPAGRRQDTHRQHGCVA